MAQCLILADDFTGACDTGLAFARTGLRTVAVTESTAIQGAAARSDVVAVDTNSRPCSSLEAARRVRLAIEEAGPECPPLVYKKVDSGLRGNLAAEVVEAMRALDRELCLVAPAFPEAGRVTVGGYHLVHGVPVERSEMGNAPGGPVRGSYLPHLIEGDATVDVQTIPLEDVEQGAAHITTMIQGLRAANPLLVVVDAASDEDLRQIALAAARLGPSPLLCGSAGLAAQVVDAFGLRPSDASPPHRDDPAGPVLFLAGSGESTTRRQVAALTKAGVPSFEMHVSALRGAPDRVSFLESEMVSDLRERLVADGAASLSLVGIYSGAPRESVQSGLQVMAQIGCAAMEAVPGTRLVVTGGWTAREALAAMGTTHVDVLYACEPGVPICRLADGRLAGRGIVTKGGAIGDDETFARVMRRLTGTKPDSHSTYRPLLGITMGDPCGVGPEIIAKALSRAEVYAVCRPLVIGDPGMLKGYLREDGPAVKAVASVEEGAWTFGQIDVLSPVDVDREQVTVGQVCVEGGRAAVAWVEAGIDLAMKGEIDGIVTAPLNKEAMNLAGHRYAGHTELLRDRTGAARARLMLATDRLSVAHVTGHIPLNEVPGRLTTEEVLETTRLLNAALAEADRPRPRIVVLGLNPHAGESGLFGDEDDEVIRPAVEQALAEGIDAVGPVPADATIRKAWAGDYDGVVAMYHDQGHVPMKLVAFDDAVNVTLGLPIIRTSVDHGTAFDIAGKGIANEGNLMRAIEMAAELAKRKALRIEN